MYYVIQVASGMEDKVEEQIGIVVEKELYEGCFHPIRRVKKKIRGEWKELREKLLPGYVFITSNDVGELYQKLRYVPAFTKMLGKDGEGFIPLAEHEVEWLKKITGFGSDVGDRYIGNDRDSNNSNNSNNSENNSNGKNGINNRNSSNRMEVEISQVSVAEDDVITILSGPLKNMEGCIKKIDLHRRIAKVEVDFMNRKTVIHLGIEMVGKKRQKIIGVNI